ncbi:MAG: V-type ATP synthase subunit E family protein [Actinobacteria bacterium]|nr:V-type ATP synthase subunit E family protein [Actinomycetota bacterium]MCL5887138.1 V-type ATP synthase subunit E family protein [Actinomycetota bacterium]
MALEDIFRALDEQAEDECAALLEAARVQASSIAADAADEAEAIRNGCLLSAQTSGQEDSARRVNVVRLDAQKRMGSVKEEIVTRVFSSSREKLSEIRRADGYPELFRALLEEAVTDMSEPPEVLVDPADEELALKTLADIGAQGSVRAEISTMGGVVVSYADGRIVRRNTIEDRLEKAIPYIKSDVAEILFS